MSVQKYFMTLLSQSHIFHAHSTHTHSHALSTAIIIIIIIIVIIIIIIIIIIITISTDLIGELLFVITSLHCCNQTVVARSLHEPIILTRSLHGPIIFIRPLHQLMILIQIHQSQLTIITIAIEIISLRMKLFSKMKEYYF